MKKYFPLLVTLAATIGAAVFNPAFIAAHPLVFAAVNGVAQVLHSALPSIFGASQSS